MNLFEFIIEFINVYKISNKGLDPKCYPDLFFCKIPYLCISNSYILADAKKM